MIKYYTRACNFTMVSSKLLIKKHKALPLCGNKYIAFDNFEIFSKKNSIKTKFIGIIDIKKLGKIEAKN